LTLFLARGRKRKQMVMPLSFRLNMSLSNKHNGFSLLEILIAMAIMAIMVALVFPNLGQTSDKLAKQEILRLVAAIELVRDQSVILNKEYGLNIDEDGYQFLVLDEDDENNLSHWSLIEEVVALGQHDFPEGLDINLSIDGENVFSSSEEDVEIFEDDVDIFENDEDKEKKIDPPQIYFLSSGEQNQFSIALAIKDADQRDREEKTFFRVRGFLTGNLKYEGPLIGDLFQDIDRDYDQQEYHQNE